MFAFCSVSVLVDCVCTLKLSYCKIFTLGSNIQETFRIANKPFNNEHDIFGSETLHIKSFFDIAIGLKLIKMSRNDLIKVP